MDLPPKALSIPFEPLLHSRDQPLLSILFHILKRVGCDFNPAAQGPESQGSLGMKPRSAYIPKAMDSNLVTVRVEIARVRGRKTLHSPLANKETGARGD